MDESVYNPTPPPPAVPQVTIPIEETPEIPMDVTGVPPAPPESSAPHRQSRRFGKSGLIILFVLLFIGGMWLSGYVGRFFPDNTQQAPDTIQNIIEIPTPSLPQATGSGIPAGTKTFTVISSTTKLPLAGIRYELPSDVLPPVCDGSACASQGTYLPGGTRFTVAPRGTGQALRDYRNTVISDTNGKPFFTKPVSVGGISAVEFTGSFTGRTVSGYSFSSMRGVMIPVSGTLSLEVNHFIPSGIVADFQADEAVFDAILKTFVIENTMPKGTLNPPVATASGY